MSSFRRQFVTLTHFFTVLLSWGVVFAATPNQEQSASAKKQSPIFSKGERSHWVYQRVERPAVPKVENADWIRNPIDAFILKKLQDKGLKPSARANRRTLIRRASFDLLGLPPTPDEIKSFLKDSRPDAYERLIDQLLASPRYGERWARHWLDLARYAESDGYKSDKLREGAWRYRDYVIRSLNDDKPYDRFLSEQLAGDELWPNDGQAIIATGFLRHWPYEDNGRDLDQMWASILDDVTDVTSQVFMGMTVRCARCHNHKFDAILRKDYYRLQAFFAPMVPRNNLSIGSNEQLASYNEKLKKWKEATRELRGKMRRLQSPFLQKEEIAKGKKFPPEIQKILRTPPDQRTLYEQQLVLLGGKQLHVDQKKMAGRMKGETKKQWDEFNRQMAKFASLQPKKLTVARGVRDINSKAPPTTIPKKSDPIEPGFLTVLDPAPAKITAPKNNPNTTGRRSALAHWLTDTKNPFTSRVLVNRLWHHHFTRGIVRSTGDFGTIGDRPTHPKLLDWLASEFIQRGWSMKQMHRLIMTSATYQQASVLDASAKGHQVDPSNKLLWKMKGRRLEAEIIRDSILATSGELNLKMYGKSVFPELPKGLTKRYAWKPTSSQSERNRRTIYLVVKRNVHLPMLKTFDVPDNHETCMRRIKTTTPTQALILFNDKWPLDRAKALAKRLLDETGANKKDLIGRIYEIVFGRPPEAREIAAGEKFFTEQEAIIALRIKKKESVAVPKSLPKSMDKAMAAAVVDYCHLLWNSNEFIYVD